MQKARNSILVFLFLLLVYSFLRFIFYQLHFLHAGVSWKELAEIVYWGMRVDATAIFYSNLIFFIYYFLFSDIFFPGRKKMISLWLLCFFNLPLLAVNIIDLAYFRFNLRRSTVDILYVIPDSLPAAGAFVRQWWWLVGLFLGLSMVSVLVFRNILKRSAFSTSYIRSNLLPCAFFLLITGYLAWGSSTRPIIPSTPLLYLQPQYQPLATNSSITVLYSMLRRQSRLKEKHYYAAPGLDSLFTITHQFEPAQPFSRKNVVLFILESFAKEYTDKNDSLHAAMPFLDSLMAESIVCNNAYSNGTESNKGLTSILAGIPPYFDEPFYYSAYSNNQFRGVGTLLKEEGYTTNFFMGANYDHFGFAKLAKLTGIEHYYSMNDYGNAAHYDGNWGIYDHYFLPFAARQLKKMNKPFFSALFSISTHFPYTLPDTLKRKFTIPGQAREQNSMSYLDYSLSLFFNEIKNESWYRNTIFVFCADHNIFWHTDEKATLYKRFRIPLFFHVPGQEAGSVINKPVQQLDVVPSILDILHYQKPFMSFGRSVFDTTTASIAVNCIDGIYQGIDSNFLFGYNEKAEQPTYLYNFRKDSALTKNLLKVGLSPGTGQHGLERHVKAVIQSFNYTMIHNKLYIK